MHTSLKRNRFISLSLSAIILLCSAPLRANAAASPTQAGRETKRSFQFGSQVYGVTEKAGSVKVTVTRSGDASGSDAVNYTTGKGTASDVSDFTRAAGRLYFAPGETEKSFDIHVIRDVRREGTETATVELRSPGEGARLGAPSTATLSIADDEQRAAAAAEGGQATNPIDETPFFVRQHYLDFLNREPDAAGLAFWTNEVEKCGADAQCREVKRINVSAAFFLSIEFQNTGYLVYRAYKAAYGSLPGRPVPITLSEFLPDTQSIGQGVVVNSPGWEQLLEANKQNYFNTFVTLPRFGAAYPAAMAPADFVNALNANAGGVLSEEERGALVSALTTGAQTRAQVLRAIAEDADLQRAEFNRAFVLMQYFGYLRRDPNAAPDSDFSGYNFWLSKLDQFKGNFIEAEMVKAFISSLEYLARFGPQTFAILPNKAKAGEQVAVEITGQFTSFIQGTTRASFGEGISVGGGPEGGFGSVTVKSRTTATAQVSVSSAAMAGARTVTVATGPERVSLDNGFTVESNVKAITSIQPGSGKQGQSVQVTVTGQNTSFAQGTTQASFGAGITVGQLTVGGPTSLTAQLDIAAGAVPGPRTVTITTGAEEVRSVDGFAVEASLPLLTLLQPNVAQQGQTLSVAITGQFTNFAQGTTQASFGAGVSVGGGTEGDFGPVNVTSPTAATAQVKVNVAASAGARTVTLRTGTEQVALAGGFTIQTSLPPQINDFTPKSAAAGTLVSVTGQNFASGGLGPQVSLNKKGGGTIAAPLSGFAADSLTFVIPTGAAPGPLRVTAPNGQTATSASQLDIVASSNFNLVTLPSTADVIRGQSVSYTVSLDSTSGFTQLATLGVTGLPAGATATFKPQQITAGQTSILDVTTPAGLAVGAVNLNVTAAATVDGIPLDKSAALTMNVRPVTTSFRGRTVVDDPLETPLAGVTVRMLGRDGDGRTTGCTGQTVSDQAGNFIFTDLPAACTGNQLVRYDGLTATAPPGRYAGVDLVYNIVANQVTVSQTLVHLPRIDNAETVMVKQNAAQDQTFVFESIPGLTATVYAGTTFTLPDGTRPDPFPFTAVEVPVDRLPDAKPPAPGMVNVFIVAFQPANTEASKPVAIYYPNSINTRPGTNMVLMTLDPTRGQMVVYGTGTVANDGSQVIPDFDPAHPGKRYGLVHFDWHGQMPPPNPANPNPEGPCGPQEGKPVDLSSGIEVLTTTDVTITGSRGTIGIERTYRTFTADVGPFGLGTSHNYGYRLNTNVPQGSAVLNLIMPDGNQYPFTRLANGSMVNTTIPSLRGAVIRTEPDGTATLRWKDGVVMRFEPGNFLLGSVLQSITDPNGNTITLTRDPSRPARITEISDPAGRKLTLSYDAADRVVSITDPIGRRVVYVYNGQGTLDSVTDQGGGVTRYTYNAQNRLTRVVDPLGATEAQNVYDANGRVIEQTSAERGRLKFEYVLLNPLEPTSPVRETTVIDALDNRTVYRFNPQGFLVSVTDALGQTRVMEREPGTNLVLAIRGAGSCNVCGYSGAGDLKFTYDAVGNRTAVTDALGDATTYTYDPVTDKVSSVGNALGQKTTYAYDERGNLVSITDTRGNKKTFTYNSFGQMTEAADEAGNKTTYGYDSVGNLVSVRDAAGGVTSMRYDGVSRVVEAADAQGKKGSLTYDNLDQVVTATDEKGQTTRLAYDAVGNLLSLTDARNNRVSFTYDAAGRLLTRTDQLGKVETYGYDAAGNLVEFKDRRGQISRFTRDALNRLLTETYADGGTVSRFYDSFDQLIRVEDSQGGVFSYDYDAAGQLVKEEGPFGVVQYTRDRAGRVASRQVVGQPRVDYTYDAAGNLTRATMPGAAADMTYDVRGLPQTVTRSNGVKSTFGYDALGRLLTLTDTLGQAVLKTHTYSYDSTGRRISHATSNAQSLITPAAAGQYDAANRLTRFGDRAFTNDENGNRLTETGPDGVTAYEWDSRNRLRKITTPSGGAVSFLYDFSENVIQQKVANGGAETTETYLLDDLTNVVHQTSGNGEQLALLTGREIDEHIAAAPAGGSARFRLTDAINSTAAVSDSEGAVVGRSFYEPFGQTTSTGVSFPFGFTGRQQVQTGVYYYRARFYDPRAGRFISEDPEGFGAGDDNLYRYVFNQPGDLTDPEGRIIPVIIGGILIGAGLDLAVQLLTNGGKLECVNWGEVAISGGIGGALGGLGGLAKLGLAARRVGNVNKLLKGAAQQGKATDKTLKYLQNGGVKRANKAFDQFVGKNPVKNQGGGIRSAKMPDGSTISVRPSSSGGQPTIQINPPSGKPIKIRY
ncbi:MAG: DUF4214 domain-containing protein [Acidobacteria bacterium]|nr:DUF4214 domain-containing protein [Acidobacteriota bacterium]MCA1619582.1 DUF4214 domain-containing protein [Acidobacteriota bacterium]